MGVVRMIAAALAALAGLAAFVYGLWLVWPPVAWIVGGLVVLFVGAAELTPTRGSR